MYEVIRDESGEIIGAEYSHFYFGVNYPVLSKTTLFGLKLGARGRIVRIEEVPRETGSSNGIMVMWDGRIAPDRMKVEELHFIISNDFSFKISDLDNKENPDSLFG